MARIHSIDELQSDPALQLELARSLGRGKLIGYPAETMYGLGAVGPDPSLDRKVSQLKGRGENQPLIYLVDSWERAKKFIHDPDQMGSQICQKLWPGPLSIIFDRLDFDGTIALRAPSLPSVTSWVESLDRLISSTSANFTGEEPIRKENDLISQFGDQLDWIVTDGDFEADLPPSTMIRIQGGEWSLIREGSIPESEIQSALK